MTTDQNTKNCENVWVFVAPSATFPSGVFQSLEVAEAWICKHGLTGTLSEYPVGIGLFDWAISNQKFKPRPDKTTDADFIGKFTTALMAHFYLVGALVSSISVSRRGGSSPLLGTIQGGKQGFLINGNLAKILANAGIFVFGGSEALDALLKPVHHPTGIKILSQGWRSAPPQ